MRPLLLGFGLLVATGAGRATAADVFGDITASGPLPARPVVDRTLDPACPPSDPGDDPLVVSRSGALDGAVVRILGPSVPLAGPLPPVIVTQRGCSYTPRVQLARTGQSVEVVNADPLLHNLHAFSDRRSLFNVAQPTGAPPVSRELHGVEVLRLKCDIHPWMSSWVVFSDNPYAAVTSRDGHFAIRGVPPGSYRLMVWQELLGTRELHVVVGSEPVHVSIDLGSPRK